MKKSIDFHVQSFWAYQPMSRLVISFGIGCLLCNFEILSNLNLPYVLEVFLAIFLIFIGIGLSKNFRKIFPAYFQGTLIHLIFFIGGIISIHQTRVLNYKNDSHLNRINKSEPYFIEVIDDPRFKQGVVSFDCNLIDVSSLNSIHSHTWKVRTQIVDNHKQQIQINDRFIVWGKLKSIQAPNIPGEFDYKSFLAKRGIFSQLRIQADQLFKLSMDDFSFKRITNSWRSKLLSQLDDSIFHPDEKQVASALLLGDRSEMNNDLIKTYSAGGIIHILAVSGLHVGLLFQALTFLFGFIPFLKKGKMNILLILMILWVYAAMTGLSPSVNRAVCMFTLIMVSNLLNRRVSPFNILSGAAFIILLLTPQVMMDIGFQLSFAAVWAILSIKPILDFIQKIPNRLFRNILAPIAISTAAQIATSPISFFVFGTFPTWFLPANLIAVPLSTLLTYCGILTLLLAKIPLLGIGFMYLFSFGIGLLNKWAIFIGTLPFAKISLSSISISQLIFYSATIFFAFACIKRISVKYLKASIITLSIGLILGIINETIFAEKSPNYIYSTSNSIHFQTNEGQHFILLQGRRFIQFPSNYQLQIPTLINQADGINVFPTIVEMLDSKNGVTINSKCKSLNVNAIWSKAGFFKVNNVLILKSINRQTIAILEKVNQADVILLFCPWLRMMDRIPIELVAKRKHWICCDPLHDGFISY